MIYRKLDDNGDYVFGANSNGFYKDIYALVDTEYGPLEINEVMN